jgi:hypothetical protein
VVARDMVCFGSLNYQLPTGGRIEVHFSCYLPTPDSCVPPIAAQSGGVDEPEANPGRPTVSTPATLTPVASLQFETGFVPATHSPEFRSRYSLDKVIKLAVAPLLEFLAVAEPIAHFSVDGASANRVADIFLRVQAVLYHGEGAKPTLAVSAISTEQCGWQSLGG